MNKLIILEEEYSNSLIDKIPLMKDEYLLYEISNYCNILNKVCFNPDNKYNNAMEIVKKITKYLNTLRGFIISNLSPESNINYIENEVIKRHKITGNALIEAIIHFTIFYYNNGITTNVRVNLSDNKINQKMNIAKGKTLGKYIVENIYIDNINSEDKNKILLEILKEIARKLQVLQNKYKFIHGDFNSQNIFIEEMGNKYNITFIDFGFSTIELPSSEEIIISSFDISNVQRKYTMDLSKYDNLKAIDLFHLIEDFQSFQEHEFKISSESYKIFNKFIKKLRNLYKSKFTINSIKKGILCGHDNIRMFTRSPDFNDRFISLYPENFLELDIDDLTKYFSNNSFKQNSSKKSRNNNNNNNALPNTSRLSKIMKIKEENFSYNSS